MSLKTYKKKRNFLKTSEPSGNQTQKAHSKTRIFVVQKHAASHLHYDFRLEMNGALKSWAVPKGPCLDPSVKRLAVEVEDHPLDYANFEGVIPKGEYGGGSVIVWDNGTWEEENDSNFKKGNLKLILYGKKLKGSWHLIRTKKSEKKPQWLLIKSKDNFSKSLKEYDIEKEELNSVLSKKTIKLENKIKKVSLPEKFKPQLATLSKILPKGNEWIYETKYDGYRILSVIKNKKIQLLSRTGKDWTDKFSLLKKELKKLPIKNAILDGEIVAQTEKSHSSFQALQNYFKLQSSKEINIHYYLFDIPFLDSHDLTEVPLIERKTLLETQVLNQPLEHIHYSEHIEGKSQEILALACKQGLEGIMAKRKNSPYIQARTEDWLKLKCHQRQEFIVIGYTAPKGERKFFGSLLLGIYKEGNLIYSGHVGTGFNEGTLKQLFELFAPLKSKTMPVSEKPADPLRRKIQWLKPKIVIEVEFTEWTSDNILRHPSFKGIREDKLPKQVTREKAKIPKLLESQAKADIEPGRKQPKDLSHPNKILYPAIHLTKAELAEYYEKIADHLLPYIKKRPISILRCPENNHSCFFQKHWVSGMPEEIKSTKVDGEDYITIVDKKGLRALAQIGVLEIHPWSSLNNKLDYPNQIIFDLDPDESLNWEKVKQGAGILREVLSTLELQSFVRVTGGKGAHVVVPIVATRNFDEIKAFSKMLSEKVSLNFPKLFVSVMSKKKRVGKIFIDYLRNDKESTAIASFSPRKDEKASVAVPISWDVFEKTSTSKLYSIRNIDDYFKDFPEDPWAGFFKSKQKLTTVQIEGLRKI